MRDLVALPHMDVEALQSKGYVTVAYPPSLRTCVQEAMQSWQSFCDLPYEKKSILSGGTRIKDFGYMLRKDSGPRSDEKEVFHALRANFDLLLPLARAIKDRRATMFIDAVDALLTEMAETVRLFAQRIEENYKLSGFEKDVMANQDNWVFRYLRYPPGTRPVFANAHADRGGFTFHLAETEEGGEYLDFEKVWRSWPVSEKQTIIFPSILLQHRSEGKLKALYHRVMPNETTTASGRFSMVAFIEFKHSHRFDDTRYRMQDFPEGFNYDQSFSEFQKLFVAV